MAKDIEENEDGISKPFSDKDLRRAKETLMQYYAEQQSSQSTRLIGFFVGLFTLFSLVQVSANPVTRLSKLFTNNSELNQLFGLIDNPILRILLLFFGSSLISYFIFRTIFRYSMLGYVSTSILVACLDGVNKVRADFEALLESTHQVYCDDVLTCLNVRAFRDLHEKYFFGRFRIYWFYSGFDPRTDEYGSKEKWGEFTCLILSLVLSVLILVLLW